MARIESLNILLDPTGHAFLAELYGKVIANVQKQTISAGLKNADLSGDPTTGSVEANRYQNSVSKAYKTARTGGKGEAIKAKPVTIKIDVDREIVEELEAKDIKLYGVDGVLERRAVNHAMSMVRELEEAFFLKAAAGAEHDTDPTGADIGKQLENLFGRLEKTRSEYVNGVDRSMFDLVLDVDTYSDVRNFLDVQENPNVDTAAEKFGMFHGVRVYSSVYLPDGIKGILMVRGSVAQPVMSAPYGAERIPLSQAFAVELFYNYGTEVVTPDLIHAWKRQLTKPVIAISSTTLTIQPVANAAVFDVYVDDVKHGSVAAGAAASTYSLAAIVAADTYAVTVIARNDDEAYKASAVSESASLVVA